MAIMKVIEVLAQSPDGWEAAAREALTHASATVRNIKSIYVQDLMAIVDDNKIVQYRLHQL